MSVEICTEVGIIIKGCRYEDLLAVCDKVDDEFAYFKFDDIEDAATDVPGHLPVENDQEQGPHYIEFDDADFPMVKMPPKPKGFQDFKKKLQRLIKGVKVTWGIYKKLR